MVQRTVNIADETARQVAGVLGGRSWDEFAEEAFRREARRHEVGRKLSQAVDAAEASGPPIPMTGAELTDTLRQARLNRQAGQADA